MLKTLSLFRLFNFFLTVLILKITFLNTYEYELSVCAIFNDDDVPYIKEWLDFHKKQGVQHFYLYNHGTMAWFPLFLFETDIEITDWPKPYFHYLEWSPLQCGSYQDCIEKVKNHTKWLAIIDTDEFLFSPSHGRLDIALKDYEQYSGVVANGIMYGTSNVKSIPKDQKLTDLLVMRGELDFYANTYVKSIVKPELVNTWKNSYCFTYKSGFAVDENRNPCHNYKTDTLSVNIFRINHYYTRDENFFFNTKVYREEKMGGSSLQTIKQSFELNAVFDDCIKEFN